ncbi:MAG: RagB/SusD family nutrient uptake outer membrane protein [Mangrovibacterium sp.]
MKRYLFIILSIFLASCDLLEQESVSTTSPDIAFGSESGLQLYINGFYPMLPTASTIYAGDNMSDIIARKEIPEFYRDGAFGPVQSSGWTWTQLRNINYFLENNINEGIDEEIRNHYNGIARFFRALFYFEKVKRFGDVPWIPKTLDVDEDDYLYGRRDSRVTIMQHIMDDLNFAIEHIGKSPNDRSRNYVTRYVAAAYKSRVALFEGTFRKYHTNYNLTDSVQWLLEAAVEAADVVMQEGNFSLNISGNEPYADLFLSDEVKESEFILANSYDTDLGILHSANWYYTSSTYGDRLNFTRRFINTYLNIDGTPFTQNPAYQTTTFPAETNNRDKRLSQTIRTPGYTREVAGKTQQTPPVFSYTYTGYQPRKWVTANTSHDNGTFNTNSIPIIRYAEVLLNFAEAKAELGTLTDSEWAETIGALRSRAGITAGLDSKPTVVDGYLQEQFYPNISDPAILEIRRERAIELALEGFRFYDMVRWKCGESIEHSWNGFYVDELNTPLDLNQDGVDDVLFYQGDQPSVGSGVTAVELAGDLRLSEGTRGELIWLYGTTIKWDDKFYLYPIPEADRLINPDLGQNPGW